MFRRLGSLQATLIVRLIVLYTAVLCLVLVVLVYKAHETGARLPDRELSNRVEEIAGYLRLRDIGDASLQLPHELASAYSATTRIYLFGIWDDDGKIIATSHPEIARLVDRWPQAGAEPDFFILEDFGLDEVEYYGLVEEVEIGLSTYSVMVAQAKDLNNLVDAIVDEFISDISWVLPLLVLATIIICVWTIRAGTAPLIEISEMAKKIGPGSLKLRLAVEHAPQEVRPLVSAVNEALDRVQKGYDNRLRFTGNAAHALRTPLAIMRARIEQSEGQLSREAFRNDIDQMARVVEQLLHLARIETESEVPVGPIDLTAIAEEIVADIAPLALAKGRSVAFNRPKEAIIVIGNHEIVKTAIINLIQNAIKFTAHHSEIQVSVSSEGSVSVRDFGPGVAESDQRKIFMPFWRANREKSDGVGLGLAIVLESARQLGGRIEVKQAAGGGSIFVFSLPLHEPDNLAFKSSSPQIKRHG